MEGMRAARILGCAVEKFLSHPELPCKMPSEVVQFPLPEEMQASYKHTVESR
jgi:hypothetical protein